MTVSAQVPHSSVSILPVASMRFRGPLFIVGMPRSGTKLLRGILNQHPEVSMPGIETEFFPYWVNHWPDYGDLSDQEVFLKFFAACQSLPFFVYLARADAVVDPNEWYRQCRGFSPAAVFEALIRVHLSLDDPSTSVWGDKSPSYITHLRLLKEHFPAARFVHIIRDVRDYCLSINHAWGKNVLRAAQRWADDVAHARASGAGMGTDYTELRYEDLLRDPSATMRRVCDFLGLEYSDRMLNLSRATENLGNTKNTLGIVRDNAGKYEKGLGAATRQAIESIACETLRAAGYECGYRGKVRRLSSFRLRLYQALDAGHLIAFSARERGLGSALRFVSRYFAVSGNRQRPKA